MKRYISIRSGLIVLVLSVLGVYFGALLQVATANTSVSKENTVPDFSLIDQNGSARHLYSYAHLDAVAIFSHGNHCNFSARTINEFQNLAVEFGYQPRTTSESEIPLNSKELHVTPNRAGPSTGLETFMWKIKEVTTRWRATETQPSKNRVMFLAINSNLHDSTESIQTNLKELGVELPLVKDDTQLVAKSLGLDRTGEVILISTRDWRIVYRGPVDDRVYYETQKDVADNRYLKDAIEAVVARKDYVSPNPQRAGCLINFDQFSKTENPADMYSSQVAPILESKCKICHYEGGIGPWSMDNHSIIKAWSPMMREVIMNRRMPPWHADQTDHAFKNDISLTTKEMRTLVDWIDAGSPIGSGPDPLTRKLEDAPQTWALGEPDLVLKLPTQHIPASGLQDYRYPLLEVNLDKDQWVSAIDVLPGNPSVVHHVFAFMEQQEDGDLVSDNLNSSDRNDEDPLWGRRSYFGVYVPGAEPYSFPDNTGVLLRKGSNIRLQLHYDPLGYATTDDLRVGLYFHDEPPKREFKVTSILHNQFEIPPFAPNHEISAYYEFDKNVRLYGLFPHMHLRGKRIKFTAEYPDMSTEEILSVPAYNFNWQRTYFFSEPLIIPAGTKITSSGAFDNSAVNRFNPDPDQTIWFGEMTIDEMFLGYMLYSEVD